MSGEYFVPIFEFGGDAYNGSAVTCIERVENTVSIHVWELEESFDHEFDDEDEAKEACAQAIAAWRKAVGS